MHAEITALRAQRNALVRRCVMLRRLQAQAVQGPHADTTAAENEERRWIAANVLRPGERL